MNHHIPTEYNFSDHFIMESLINFNPIVIDIPDRITWDFDEQLIGDFNREMIIKMDKVGLLNYVR